MKEHFQLHACVRGLLRVQLPSLPQGTRCHNCWNTLTARWRGILQGEALSCAQTFQLKFVPVYIIKTNKTQQGMKPTFTCNYRKTYTMRQGSHLLSLHRSIMLHFCRSKVCQKCLKWSKRALFHLYYFAVWTFLFLFCFISKNSL